MKRFTHILQMPDAADGGANTLAATAGTPETAPENPRQIAGLKGRVADLSGQLKDALATIDLLKATASETKLEGLEAENAALRKQVEEDKEQDANRIAREALIARKVGAGLTRHQAMAVMAGQEAHDALEARIEQLIKDNQKPGGKYGRTEALAQLRKDSKPKA